MALPLIVVMGVSGSGKTTVGEQLAIALGVPFADADSFHPQANVAKMAAGHPLDDSDRWPWLSVVGLQLARASATGMVMACSALKRTYREAILAEAPDVEFVELDVPRDVLKERMLKRIGHFMPESLLDSQLETLEPLEKDEPGIRITADQPVPALVLVLSTELRRGNAL